MPEPSTPVLPQRAAYRWCYEDHVLPLQTKQAEKEPKI